MMQLHVVPIDFRNDKRNTRVHPEHGGIIDYDGSRIPGYRSELAGNLATSTEQGNVDAAKGIARQFFDCNFFSLKRNRFPGGTH